jgi:heme oxygenase
MKQASARPYTAASPPPAGAPLPRMSPSPPQPLLAALRRATRERHDRIEALLRLDAPMTRRRYGAILRGFHAFLGCWEPAVRAALPARLHDWFDVRCRSRFAAEDLRFLGAETVPQLAERAQRAVGGLSLAAHAAPFGSMYVIEGSALGGQVLVQRLADSGLAPGRGASYFHGFGERTGAMWREFRELAATEVGPGREALETACREAERTFDALLATFEPIATFEPLAA